MYRLLAGSSDRGRRNLYKIDVALLRGKEVASIFFLFFCFLFSFNRLAFFFFFSFFVNNLLNLPEIARRTRRLFNHRYFMFLIRLSLSPSLFFRFFYVFSLIFLLGSLSTGPFRPFVFLCLLGKKKKLNENKKELAIDEPSDVPRSVLYAANDVARSVLSLLFHRNCY